MRKFYTESHNKGNAKEQVFVEDLHRIRPDLRFEKTPDVYQREDRKVFKNGKHVGFAEFKGRNHDMRRYENVSPKGTWMISASKYLYLVELSLNYELPSWFFVRWDDQDRMVQTSSDGYQKYEIKEGGRSDRQDPLDIEPCLFIPFDHMRPIHVRQETRNASTRELLPFMLADAKIGATQPEEVYVGN